MHFRAQKKSAQDVSLSDYIETGSDGTPLEIMDVDIYFSFIGRFTVPEPGPTVEDLAEAEALQKKRAANRRKYERRKERLQQIKEGIIAPDQPYDVVCITCGKAFQSMRPQAKYCTPACQQRYYRQTKQEKTA